jgi:deazaflavin-dependent oxidoreductase (nitroreductase family)
VTGAGATKRRRVRLVQRYLLNPPVKLVARLGLAPGYALLETTGRRSGRRRRSVVGVHREGTDLWIVSEQGVHAGYVNNLLAQPRVRVCLRGRWHSGTASLLEDDDPVARLETFGRRTHARAVRRFGTELATIRIALDDAQT